jgi:geranylgeranyl diphosphate synthase type I
MHTILNKLISKRKDIKFNGQDLAIIVGDVIFAMAFGAFLAINEDPRRKESALKKLIAATIYTGSGEFIELLAGLKAIDKITQGQIYHIYDYKTANYTFSSPLVMGAILAGADKEEINKLFKYGIYLGRAFQINDDILGMFGSQEKIGKSVLSDVQEAKKTLIIWHAFHHSAKKKQQLIKRIFAQKKIGRDELLTMRKIILASGALDFARAQVASLLKKAELLSQSLQMRPKYKKALINYSRKMLSI